MDLTMVFLVLLAVFLVIWIVSIMLNYLVKDKRTKAVEMEAVSIHLLCKQVERLNNRIDSCYQAGNKEQEEPE